MSDDDEQEAQPQLYRSLLLNEPGAWYWLGTMFPYVVEQLATIELKVRLELRPSSWSYGTQWKVIAPDDESRKVGTMVFNRPGPGDAPANALVWDSPPEYESFWDLVCLRLQDAQQKARALRRTHEGVPPNEAIELYYRAKAAGSRATLRSIADLYNLNYDYLRKVKRQYDAAGKWGSKREPKGSPENVE